MSGNSAVTTVGKVGKGAVRAGTRLARAVLSAVIVLTIVGTVLLLAVVGRVSDTYQEGLAAVRDGADVTALGTGSLRSLASDVAELARSASSTVAQTRAVLDGADDAAAGVGTALGTNLADSLQGVTDIANGMAGLVEKVEALIPGQSDSLAENLREIADGLEPAPQQLRDLGTELEAAASELGDALPGLSDAARDLSALATSVESVDTALVDVSTLAERVKAEAAATLDRSASDFSMLRALILAVGGGIVLISLAASYGLHRLGRAAGGD